MDEVSFLIAMKSTLDKIMNDLRDSLAADYPTLKAVEVDDMAQTDEEQKSEDPTLIWSMGTLRGHPNPPLYRVEFLVGVKTTNDAGNYIMTSLLSEVRRQFKQGDSIDLFDYSGAAAAAENSGTLYIGGNEVAQQEFDRQSGLRYALVSGNAVAYG